MVTGATDMFTTTSTKIRALTLAFLLVIAAFLAAPPADATTAPGYWWTNHSRCSSPGAYVDTQGYYRNWYDGALAKTQVRGVATNTVGHGYVRRIQVWTYADSPQRLIHYLDRYTPTQQSVAVYYTTPFWLTYQDGHGYAVYRVTTVDGYTCQGQWNIGQ
jgi:hypothetical protein